MKLYKRVIKALYTLRVRKQCSSVGEGLTVNRLSNVGKNTILGDNVNFNGIQIDNGPCRIGNNFHSGRNCQILNQNHNYEGEYLPYDRSFVYKEVIIEDNVWLGNNVLILGNVHIGEGAIVQAGAVVVSDVPKCAIVGGNPAKIYKYRDIEHYDRLKLEGRFLSRI